VNDLRAKPLNRNGTPRTSIAVVCPDGRSIVLFCGGLIKGMIEDGGADVAVITDAGASRAEIEALGARVIQVPLYRFFNPAKDAQYFLRLYRVFRKEQFDVVYNMSTKPNIYGVPAAHLAGVPRVISHVVGLGSALLPSSSFRSKVLRFVFLTLYRLSGRWSDHVWFWNENDLRFFLDRRIVRPERALLTKTVVDLDYYSPGAVTAAELSGARVELGIREDDRVVLMVARMIWPKGIREFVDAARSLAPYHPDWRFLLMAPLEPGNPDEVPASFVEQNAAAANLTWIQYRNDLRPFYALADLTVLPSFYRGGGHPRAIVEAMAMGKAVITTDNEDCRDAVEHERNGYWVPMRDSKAVADAIARLLTDPALLQRFGEHSRTRALEFFDERRIVAKALQTFGLTKRGTDSEHHAIEPTTTTPARPATR
jgi:glycosyltransferase involved in cell wall biosynthesis